MSLDAPEFIGHFLIRVLPRGLQRIRHYWFLSNRRRETGLAECRRLLAVISPPATATDEIRPDYRDRYARLTGRSLRVGPVDPST